MSAAVKAPRTPIATLKLSKRVLDVLALAKSIATAMTVNATSFPSPTPPLATFEADVAALDAAEAAVLSRMKGAAETRNLKLATVRADLENLKAYVQSVVHTNPSAADVLIQNAGMSVKKLTLHSKAPLVAKQGLVSGTAHLLAKSAARRAAYEWQYSTDQKTWTSAPSTLQAKTTILGLTAGTTYYFRVRAVAKAGEGNWTQLVSFLVA